MELLNTKRDALYPHPLGPVAASMGIVCTDSDLLSSTLNDFVKAEDVPSLEVNRKRRISSHNPNVYNSTGLFASPNFMNLRRLSQRL
jgi:hypothetical protein